MSSPNNVSRARISAVNEAILQGGNSYSAAIATTAINVGSLPPGYYLITVVSATATTAVFVKCAASAGTTAFSAITYGSAGGSAAIFRGDVAQEIIEVPSGLNNVQAQISTGTATLYLTRLS